MAVAKRQARENRTKKRSQDQSEDFRQNKQHSWLSPICIGQAQVEEKHIKGGAKALSLSFSPTCMCSFSLSPSPTHSSTLFPSSLWVGMPSHFKDGISCYLLIKQSCDTDLPKRYNKVCPRPKSCDAPRALMSVAPNLRCDETKN